MLQINQYRFLFLAAVFIFVFNGFAAAQTDPNKQDSLAVKTDTIPVVKQDTAITSPKEDKKKSKKKSNFIIYGGGNLNTLDTENGKLESNSKAGWQLGASYMRGRFFYWQVGMMYNSAKYHLTSVNDSVQNTAQTFSFNSLDVPLTAGIKLLPFLNKVFNIRLFLSAVPSFRLNVSDNPLVTKDNSNSFNMYGQGGLGIDVLFLVIELGYNYGFTDLLENQKSKPGQAFVNLGIRF